MMQATGATPRPEPGATSELYGFDVFSPREIARRVQEVGIAKARLPLLQTAMLGMLAGAFIGIGALYYALLASDATLGFAAARLAGGLAFSLGLVLVVVAGAELFTGNNLLAMAWANGRIGTLEVLRNWALVCAANFAGAAGLAVLVYLSGHWRLNGGAVGTTVLKIAAAKAALPAWNAFLVGGSVLVALVYWVIYLRPAQGVPPGPASPR